MRIKIKEESAAKWRGLEKRKLEVTRLEVKEVGRETEGFWMIPVKECEITNLQSERVLSIKESSMSLAAMLEPMFVEFGESCYARGYLAGRKDE